jgi:UDP-N-acetyl-D-mannosaminuronic acid dehydrogenase
MVKLMENTYRDVNIALANEFALISERIGIDVWEAISLANRHPRVDILRPGPGVGGHCIAVDPWFIVNAAPELAQIIRTAREINDAMPSHVVELVRDAVAGISDPVVTCLGLAYKAGVDDARESPSIEVLHLLQKEGYEVRACDPHIPPSSQPGINLLPLQEALDGSDCAVVLTDHQEFFAIPAQSFSKMRHAVVVDTRNSLCSRPDVAAQVSCVRLGAASNRNVTSAG